MLLSINSIRGSQLCSSEQARHFVILDVRLARANVLGHPHASALTTSFFLISTFPNAFHRIGEVEFGTADRRFDFGQLLQRRSGATRLDHPLDLLRPLTQAGEPDFDTNDGATSGGRELCQSVEVGTDRHAANVLRGLERGNVVAQLDNLVDIVLERVDVVREVVRLTERGANKTESDLGSAQLLLAAKPIWETGPQTHLAKEVFHVGALS